MGERLAVVLVTDDLYSGFAAVACTSMLESAADPAGIECHILHSALRPETRERLRRAIEQRKGTVRFHDLRPAIEEDPRYQEYTSHFLRLLAPDVLPPEIVRFLYLDCDLIVRKDVRALGGMDLKGKVVAACRDYLGSVQDAVSNYRALGLAGDSPYFNSGVMIVDRALWRRHQVSERVLQCTAANRDFLYAQGRFFQYDQYGLNVVLYRHWEMLDLGWNYGSEYPFREVGIVHFNGHGKPWSPSCTPEFRREFHACLEGAGWRQEEMGGPGGEV